MFAYFSLAPYRNGLYQSMNGDTLRQLFERIGIKGFSGVVIAWLYEVGCDAYGFALSVVGVRTTTAVTTSFAFSATATAVPLFLIAVMIVIIKMIIDFVFDFFG